MTKSTPAANAEAAKSTKWMNYLFPIMSFIFCLNYNAAFAIYWTLTSLIMILVNVILNKKFPRTPQIQEETKQNENLGSIRKNDRRSNI